MAQIDYGDIQDMIQTLLLRADEEEFSTETALSILSKELDEREIEDLRN